MPWLSNSFTQYSLWVIRLQKLFRNNKAYFLPLKKSDQAFFSLNGGGVASVSHSSLDIVGDK